MQLELKDLQFFYLAVIGFAFIGLRRGWRRELFSLVFALSGVVFLFFGLGQFLAQFFFLRLPAIVQLGATGAVDNKPASAYTLPANDGRILFTTVLTFIIIVIAGYLIGNKAFPKPATAQERILGVIPSVIAGFVLVAYLTNFAKNQITLAIDTPNQSSIGSYLSIIFIIAIVALVIGLVVASAKKKGGPPPKK